MLSVNFYYMPHVVGHCFHNFQETTSPEYQSWTAIIISILNRTLGNFHRVDWTMDHIGIWHLLWIWHPNRNFSFNILLGEPLCLQINYWMLICRKPIFQMITLLKYPNSLSCSKVFLRKSSWNISLIWINNTTYEYLWGIYSRPGAVLMLKLK